MIADEIINLHIKAYLDKFHESFEAKQHQKKQLHAILSNSAALIQKKFRLYMNKKKFRAAFTIQKWWKKKLREIIKKRDCIKRFNQTYKKGIVMFFLKSKLAKNHKFSSENKNFKAHLQKNNKISLKNFLTHIVCQRLLHLLTVRKSIKAQIVYISKYEHYNRDNFQQQWRQYEEKLKAQLWKQINRKWVKKKGSIYIVNNQKQIDAETYVKKQIEKIFQQHYQSHETNQLSLIEARNKLMQSLRVHEQLYKQLSIEFK